MDRLRHSVRTRYRGGRAERISGLPSRSSESRPRGQTSTQIPSRLHFSLSTFIRLICELIQLRLEVRVTRRRLYLSQLGLGIVCSPVSISSRLLAFQFRSGARSRNFVGKSRIDRPLLSDPATAPEDPFILAKIMPSGIGNVSTGLFSRYSFMK